MSQRPQYPSRRARTRTLRVPAVDSTGRPVVLELHCEQWLHPRTRRYRRVWSARPVGRLSWEPASSAQQALRRAAYVPEDRRPAWLADAVRAARLLLREPPA